MKPKCDHSKKDGGQIYEEDKAMARRLTGPKSRWSWGGWGENFDEIAWGKKGKK